MYIFEFYSFFGGLLGEFSDIGAFAGRTQFAKITRFFKKIVLSIH